MGELRKMQPSMLADGLIAVAAFRYALGRQSYMVTHVADWLIANSALLPRGDRDLICREIDSAERLGRIGMDMDRRDWMRVKDALAPQDAP